MELNLSQSKLLPELLPLIKEYTLGLRFSKYTNMKPDHFEVFAKGGAAYSESEYCLFESGYCNDEGKLHGNCKGWYENGVLNYDHNYKNGKLHGNYKKWRENGELRCDANYKNDELHGKCKSWYYSGELWSDLNYKNGKEV